MQNSSTHMSKWEKMKDKVYQVRSETGYGINRLVMGVNACRLSGLKGFDPKGFFVTNCVCVCVRDVIDC